MLRHLYSADFAVAVVSPARATQFVLIGLSVCMIFSAVVTVVAVAPRIENPRSRRIFTAAIVVGNLAALFAMYVIYTAQGS